MGRGVQVQGHPCRASGSGAQKMSETLSHLLAEKLNLSFNLLLNVDLFLTGMISVFNPHLNVFSVNMYIKHSLTVDSFNFYTILNA